MSKGYKTFGVLTVRHPDANPGPSSELRLTFIEPDVMAETEGKLLALGFEIVDSSPSYELFRDVERAVRCVEVFCRPAIQPRTVEREG